MKKLSVLAFALVASGCASITRGIDEDVIIQYTPVDATVRTSLNHTCTLSPCTVSVARKKEFQVFATKDGYEPQTVNVGTKTSGKGATGFAGNILLGGVGGMVVDASTGAALDHYPNPVIINLLPIGSTPIAPAVSAPSATTPPAAASSGTPTS